MLHRGLRRDGLPSQRGRRPDDPCILTVEDDPLSQDLVRGVLASQGYAVDAAADSFEGLKLARDNRDDLALVDYHLPDLDGYASARLLRDLADTGGARPKLVALTADRTGLLARGGADTAFDAIPPKPIEPAALLGCVAAMLGAPPPARTAAPEPAPAQAATPTPWLAP